MKEKKQILYGEANFKVLTEENGYYVDKTGYIRLLEEYKSPVFLRPRRFGKSLLCTTLQYYYDINYQDQFDELFGQTEIGRNPTPNHNKYLVLSLDFSSVGISGEIEKIEHRFNLLTNNAIQKFVLRNNQYFEELPKIDQTEDASINLEIVLNFIDLYNLPHLYIIIDEYDNFANQLITSRNDDLYRELTGSDSFFKTFFKTIKKGKKEASVAKVFITGILPITIDDLASAYNIAEFLTLDLRFECMMGFTQEETDKLLDEVYQDYELDTSTRKEVNSVIKSHYNGYHIVNPNGESLYNSTILMYFLRKLTDFGEIPKRLTDNNLKTDISWVKRITNSNPEDTAELVDQLTIENKIAYNEEFLSEEFNMSQFFEKEFFPVSFYYLGMLTKRDEFFLCLPNLNMKSIFTGYFNEIHQIDVSTIYYQMMNDFINKPDLPRLFTDYWKLYISQLPEAIFMKVNENLYRTTFYHLCSQYLSGYFTWSFEHSYASGRTDLEFIGKFHNKYAGLRILIEFKYFSNTETNKKHHKIPTFQLIEDDKNQAIKYKTEVLKEYPEGNIQCFVIYCFGNQGFRVFEV